MLSAGDAEKGKVPETDEQMEAVANGPGATPPNDENDGVASVRTGKASNADTSAFDSPIFPRFQLGRRQVDRAEENIAEEQEPVRDQSGRPLEDGDGNYFFAQLGWRAMRDQFGEVCCSADGEPLFEEVDEDTLALVTRETDGPTLMSSSEQTQQLQNELQQSRFVHRSDVDKLEQMLDQQEAQSAADHRALVAEMEKRQAESEK